MLPDQTTPSFPNLGEEEEEEQERGVYLTWKGVEANVPSLCSTKTTSIAPVLQNILITTIMEPASPPGGSVDLGHPLHGGGAETPDVLHPGPNSLTT